MVVRGNEAMGDVPGVFRLALLDGAVVLRAGSEVEGEMWVSKLEEMQQVAHRHDCHSCQPNQTKPNQTKPNQTTTTTTTTLTSTITTIPTAVVCTTIAPHAQISIPPLRYASALRNYANQLRYA